MEFGQTTRNTFTVTLGGDNDDRGLSVQETSDGGFIVTGTTYSYGAGYTDVLLSKFNPDGSHNWTTTFGGMGEDEGESVQETRDGGYIVVGDTSSFGSGLRSIVFLSKFNSDGTHSWTITLDGGGGGNDYGKSVQVTRDGGYIVTGSTYINIFGADFRSVVLLSKFNFDGRHNWTTTFGGSDADEGYSVQETRDGGYIVVGKTWSFGEYTDVFLSKFNSDGSHNWTTILGGDGHDSGYSVQETTDGGYIVAGCTDSYGAGYNDVLLSKFNPDGSNNWTTTFGGISHDYGYSVQETRDGGYIVTGSTGSFGYTDVLLSKFNSDGSHDWTTTLDGGGGSDRGRSVQQTREDGRYYIVTGSTEISFGAGSYDVLLSKFNADGRNCDLWVAVSPEISNWEGVTIDYNPNVNVIEKNNVIVNIISPTFQRISPDFDYKCYNCFGVDFNSYDKVCSGHGVCSSIDNCTCSPGYISETTICQDWSCNGIHYMDSDVCSNHGRCTSPDNCDCDKGYDLPGFPFCEQWECFEVQRDSSGVCNSHGECTSPDYCICSRNWGGEECRFDIGMTLGLSISLPLTGLLIFTCVSLCIVCTCFLLVICCCFVCFCGTFLIIRLSSQRKRIKQYSKLKDFDLLLKEQLLEEKENYAKLDINKSLYSIEMDDIRTINILGEGGSNSIVFKAEWAGKIVAYKCFKTRTLMSDQECFEEFEREVQILSSVAHPHIIQFFGACLKTPRVGIVMEYCPNGEILEFILKFRDEYLTGYPIPEKIRLLVEVCSALEYLHNKNVIHRDLKCENVLISESKSAKLMDFGVSRVVERMSDKKTSRIGTSVYMPPEVVNGENYDEKCDVFSLGIMIYVLLKENPNPYGGRGSRVKFKIEFKVANDPSFRPNMDELELPEPFSDWMKKLISNCLLHDSNERKSCKEIREILQKKGLEEGGSVIEGDREEEEEKKKGNLKEVI